MTKRYGELRKTNSIKFIFSGFAELPNYTPVRRNPNAAELHEQALHNSKKKWTKNKNPTISQLPRHIVYISWIYI